MAALLRDVTDLLVYSVSTVIHTILRPFWLHLWPPVQLIYLISKRFVLRYKNIHDVSLLPNNRITEFDTPDHERTWEGSLNNKDYLTMGMVRCPFGRNTPATAPPPAGSLPPGPDIIKISDNLLSRRGRPAKTRPLVNLLGGAWIQFMTHDWFQLDRDKTVPPLTWRIPEGTMTLHPLVTDEEGEIPMGDTDHWWSGSQIYGDNKAAGVALRTRVDGKMALNPANTYLPIDTATGLEKVGFPNNLWSGVTLLHYLFVSEHNIVCTMLKMRHPDWTDDQLYGRARLIIAALIAKIHTVEWTSAIIQHPTGRAVQYILWYGIIGALVGRKLLWLRRATRRLGFISETLFGIPGGDTVLGGRGGGKPFAHTHEFVAVYRMHSLLPEKINLLQAATGAVAKVVALADLIFQKGTEVNQVVPLEDLVYSLGVGHAGALELNNYPSALRALNTPEPDKQLIDLAATDVFRCREVRLPLYNQFRKSISLPPVTNIETFARGDTELASAFASIYGDPNNVDIMVGLLSEKPIPGFIFGEATYSIFVLQTQRRIESDRFFTESFNNEVYTPEGMNWIETTTMSDMLRRHLPQLAAHLTSTNENAFIPWEVKTKRAIHEKVFWDLLFPWKVYRWLRAAE